jgi:hypothetical protein
LDTKQGKILIFSALGFETKKVKTTENFEVHLKMIAFPLDEVIIEKRKESKEQIIGDSRKMWFSHLAGKTPFVMAKFFKYQEEYQDFPFIKNALVFTKSEIKNASFKLRLFKVGGDGFPSEDISNEDIIVYVKKGRQKNVIDLSSLNLKMPKEGIFIAFESMIIKSNEYEYNSTAKGAKKSKDIAFAPSLICNPVENDFAFNYLGGKWRKTTKISLSTNFLKNKIIEPAINLTLTN